ncbi:hypothetical protein H7169_02040 [Candidatus Gracilibacteria bacterium]|nr:hypothetical protein [Candidatus Gracilibacteria bacterium]
MLPNNIIQKNRVYAPIIVGITLLLVMFLLYPLYTSHADTRITIAGLEKTKLDKQLKIDEVKRMQALFAGSGSSDLKAKVEKYNHRFNSSDIMETIMVNKYTTNTQLSPAQIAIGSISINEGKKLPSGLTLGSVGFTLSADTPDQVVDYLTYLTTNSPLAITIDTINLPLDTAGSLASSTAISLAITLGVYYYE